MAIVLSILQSIFLALITTGVTIGLAWVLPHRKEQDEGQVPNSWILPFAIALGFLVGFGQVIDHWYPEFPPTDSTQWTYYIVFPTLLFSLLKALNKWPHKIGNIFHFILIECYFYLLLSPLIGEDGDGWGFAKGLLIISSLALVTSLFWFGLRFLAKIEKETKSSPLISGAWIIATLSSSLFFILGHSASLNQLASILSASIGVLFLLSLKYPKLDYGKGLMGIILVPYLGLNISAYFFSELPLWAIASPCSILLVSLTQLSFFRKRSVLKVSIILLCTIGLLNGFALGAYYLSQPVEEADPYGYDYSLNISNIIHQNHML